MEWIRLEGASETTQPHSVLLKMWSLKPREEQRVSSNTQHLGWSQDQSFPASRTETLSQMGLHPAETSGFSPAGRSVTHLPAAGAQLLASLSSASSDGSGHLDCVLLSRPVIPGIPPSLALCPPRAGVDIPSRSQCSDWIIVKSWSD